jgi:hypothetical protein
MLLAPVAQAEWLPPVDISETGEHAGVPHLALDSEGNATAVWDRWDGTATVVETAFRPAGSPWGAPQALSPPDSQSAQVVVDRNGVLTAAWQRWTGVNHFAIESASRMPGQSWTEPVEITDFQQGSHPEPWLAVDWEGNNTVVWKQGETIMSSFRTFLGSWGEPVPLSPGESFTPETAMDGRGDATAVWMHDDGSDYVVESAYRPEQGEWEEAELVSQPGEEGGNPQVAVDGQGDSLVVWRGEDEGEEFVRAAYRPAGGSWSEPENVSTEGEQVGSLHAAVDPAGNAIVAWSGNFGNVGEYDVVHTSYKPAGGKWEEPADLSEEGANGYVNDVVFDQSGNAAILWQRWDGVDWLIRLRTARRAKNGKNRSTSPKKARTGWTPPSSSTPRARRRPPTETPPRSGSAPTRRRALKKASQNLPVTPTSFRLPAMTPTACPKSKSKRPQKGKSANRSKSRRRPKGFIRPRSSSATAPKWRAPKRPTSTTNQAPTW